MAGPAIGHWGNSYPAHLDAYVNASFLGLSREDVQNLATLENCELEGGWSGCRLAAAAAAAAAAVAVSVLY